MSEDVAEIEEKKFKIEKAEKNHLILNRLDISFGELLNMYKDEELIIRPEYQRCFRWDAVRQSAFIESILMRLPIPSIFVFAREDGTYELLDGLQRLSTVFAFMGELKDDTKKRNNFNIKEAPLIPGLEGKEYNDLDRANQLDIKRRYIRMDIISSTSSEEMKYEFFKRINSSAEPLSEQEMRNCIYHGDYNDKIVSLAREICEIYGKTIFGLTDKQRNNMYLEGLILRYYAFADEKSLEIFKGKSKNYSDGRYLDNFMKLVNKEKKPFLREEFLEKIGLLDSLFGSDKERKKLFRAPKTEQFLLGIYDCIIQGTRMYWEEKQINPEEIREEDKTFLRNKIQEFFKGSIFEQYEKISDESRKRTIERIKLAKKHFMGPFG